MMVKKTLLLPLHFPSSTFDPRQLVGAGDYYDYDDRETDDVVRCRHQAVGDDDVFAKHVEERAVEWSRWATTRKVAAESRIRCRIVALAAAQWW